MPDEPLLVSLTDLYNQATSKKFGPAGLDIFAAMNSDDREVQFDLTIALNDLAEGLSALVIKDQRFAGDCVRYIRTDNGQSGFYPAYVGVPLLRKAIQDKSPQSAINWFSKIMSTRSATGKTIHALWGAPVKEPIQLTDDVQIVSLDDVPDSWTKQWLMNAARSGNRGPVQTMLDFACPESALILTQTIDPFLSDGEPRETETYIRRHELLTDIALVLTIVGRRVSMSAAYWFVFDDPDLERARMGSSRGGHLHEILPSSPTEYDPLDPQDAIRTVHAYLSLDPSIRSHMRVAIERLNLSLRRRNVGDRAVELAVAFESLLGDKANNEMMHKITTRSVRIVGGLPENRQRNSQLMKKTYEIRSKLVHTGVSDPGKIYPVGEEKLTAVEVIGQCTDFCIQVIRALVFQGQIPEWTAFDING